jgi:hypothetical protein
MRDELIHLGLVRRDVAADALYLTPDGRRFLA